MPEMRECELVGRESEDVEEDPNAEASRAAGKAIHTEGCSSCMGRKVQRALVWNGARQRSGGANPVVAEPPPSHPPLSQLSGVDLAELGDMLDRAARIAAWRSVPRASEILRRSSTSAVARSPADVLFGSSEPELGDMVPPFLARWPKSHEASHSRNGASRWDISRLAEWYGPRGIARAAISARARRGGGEEGGVR
jgi:hypothetical protein